MKRQANTGVRARLRADLAFLAAVEANTQEPTRLEHVAADRAAAVVAARRGR